MNTNTAVIPTCTGINDATLEILNTSDWNKAENEYRTRIKPFVSEHCHDYRCRESFRYDIELLGIRMQAFKTGGKSPMALRLLYMQENRQLEAQMMAMFEGPEDDDDGLVEVPLGPIPTTPDEIPWDVHPMPDMPAFPADVPPSKIIIALAWKERFIH